MASTRLKWYKMFITILAIVLLLMGLFSTTVAIVYEDLSMLIPAALCYLPCGIVLTRMIKTSKGGFEV